MILRRAMGAAVALSALWVAGPAAAHEGHGMAAAWEVCEGQTRSATCSWEDEAHRYRGTCQQAGAALLCVRNRPLEALGVEPTPAPAPAPAPTRPAEGAGPTASGTSGREDRTAALLGGGLFACVVALRIGWKLRAGRGGKASGSLGLAAPAQEQ